MTNGRAIAMTVVGLLLAAAPSLGNADDKTKEAKVKCSGINACKGKGGCAGANNDCAGKNGCKGKGVVEATEKECKDKKGTVVVADKGAPKKDAAAPKDAPKDAPKK
jgi:hypothetical protein